MRGFFFVCCGHLSLATGIIGIFLPVLPTTPFVLLACGCYARGSKRFHKALLENKWFGPLITDWNERGSIPVRAKVLATVIITASITWAIVIVPFLPVKVGLGILGIAVASYILTRPSRKSVWTCRQGPPGGNFFERLTNVDILCYGTWNLVYLQERFVF